MMFEDLFCSNILCGFKEKGGSFYWILIFQMIDKNAVFVDAPGILHVKVDAIG